MESARKQTVARSFVGADGLSLDYRWYEPKTVNGKLPLVVFLHGSGERGSGNYEQLLHGVPEFIDYSVRKGRAFFLLAPQCPLKDHPTDPQGVKWVQIDWSDQAVQTMPEKPSQPMAALLELLAQVRKDPRVDTSHIYVTGISMGGYGTWDLACRRPDWFAAVMPLCGGCDEKAVRVLKGTPVKIVHGDADTAVPTELSRRAFASLKAAGGKVDYIEYPGVGHNCWDRTYRDDAILDWLFSQHL